MSTRTRSFDDGTYPEADEAREKLAERESARSLDEALGLPPSARRSTSPKKYVIEAETIEGLTARLVYLMKLEEFESRSEEDGDEPLVCETSDGSRVHVFLSDLPMHADAAVGITRRGVRLG